MTGGGGCCVTFLGACPIDSETARYQLPLLKTLDLPMCCTFNQPLIWVNIFGPNFAFFYCEMLLFFGSLCCSSLRIGR